MPLLGLLRIAAGAGVRGVLKGCATPGLEVAEGAPEDERGAVVVEVSEVVGVEYWRDGVVVREREARVVVGGARRERRVRQRVQIMVVVCCVGRGFGGCGFAIAQWTLGDGMEVRGSDEPKAETGSFAEVRFGREGARDQARRITLHERLLFSSYINLCIQGGNMLT